MDDVTIVIRGFNPSDREGVRDISCRTAFLEKPSGHVFQDDEILADVLTLYFTDYEPDSSFVAAHGDKVVGYLTGAKNVKKMLRVFLCRIMPRLVLKAVKRGVFLKKTNIIFLKRIALSWVKGEFFIPDFSGDYPATLHINIHKDFRGFGTGRALIERYLEFLKKENVSGLHFGVMSDGAKNFFIKMGFKVLFEGKRSYLRSYFEKEVPYYIIGKKDLARI